MKKLYSILILFFLTLFFNINKVNAETISKYYINATILDNGNLEVEEYIDLNGEYNGYERIIKYANENAENFNENTDSLGGNKLHNAKNIQIVSVKGVSKSNDNIDNLFNNINGDEFLLSDYASVGSYGKYTVDQFYQGLKIRIYNNYKAFYIKYIVEDLGVLYNDYGEIGWNIFTEQKENIDDFQMRINIPNNKNELRAWAHGQLTGNIRLDGKTKVYVNIKDYDARYPFDVRVLFDRENIINSTKIIDINALNKILNYENQKANEANNIRNKFRLLMILEIIFIITLIFLIIRNYFKYDKEYKGLFTHKYYRDFPSDKSPSAVEYLLNKQITAKALSATILNLIYKKKIEFTKIKDNDYTLTLIDDKDNLSMEEKEALLFVFDDKNTITLSELKKRGKKHYESVMNNYNNWHAAALVNAESYKFFEENKKVKSKLVLLPFAFIIIDILFFMEYMPNNILNSILLILSIICIIYILVSSKRTRLGNEEYLKWNALKNFMNDFGKFNDKDLPQIVLWEKYLVYATIFGIAKKLSKQMEIKINSNPNYYNYTPIYNNYSFSDVIIFNSLVTNSINTSYNNAHSAQVSASSSSSGSGFGGGFSSGGGSFGGGGGGGRF